jgi:hypothetical protein
MKTLITYKRHMQKDNQITNKYNDIKQSQNDVSFNLFETNKDFVKVYKKTEKIVSAIYLLTNHFDEKEPMKWNLRDQGNQILVSILKIRDIGTQESRKARNELTSSIAEIVSLFEVAYVSGIVSEKNFKLLKQEFLNLITITTEFNNRTKTELTAFDKTFFAVEDNEQDLQEFTKNPKGHYKGHLSNLKQNPLNNVAKAKVVSPEPAKNDAKKVINSSPKEDVTPDMYEVKTPSDMRKTNRRSLILNAIKKKGGVMIKDLVPIVKGCSEKTIQRELAVLISSGIIKKEGERRWSVYKMA